jgi:hypothetical protein
MQDDFDDLDDLDEFGDADELDTKLSHAQQVAILQEAIREYAKFGWRVWKQPTPYEVALRRKSGLMAREFMSLWVEEDGTVMENYAGEGGRLF